jgi:eukaryotic-like serine/threonine-protein kinase
LTSEGSLAGRRFGDYEVLEELGSGGMGRVYRARNVALDRVVALKTLATQFSADEGFVRRFQKEARAAARLNHPSIVQIYDFGTVEGIYYLAMEFVDGSSLRALLKKFRFRERDALLVIRHTVAALAVAHAEGIVHRDIKPDNIMLTAKGDKVKLVDLGIAKTLGEDQSLTQTGQAVGTPEYIAPEQIRGLRDIDARADIYSLGATYFQLVTGHAPYQGTSGAMVMSMHLTSPLPDPRAFEPSLSEGLVRVLRKMMAKEREHRYADVHALDRDLYRLQIGEPVEADGVSLSAIATFVDPRAPTKPLPPAAAPSAAPAFGAPTPAPTAPAPDSRAHTPVATTPAPTSQAPAFREEDLHFVEVELAKRIGPLARVLIKKAARTAPNLVALGAAVADQIADEEDRRSFRNAVRARAN